MSILPYNVVTLVKVPRKHDYSFKDINRTEANTTARLAGNESQHEDRPKPERRRVGLRKGLI